jgi:uncharacterized coiled-coil protein SlyX
MFATGLPPEQVASQFDSVALWTGLIGSIVGIVLSIVAMIFTWVVNKRSDKISDHTIQSLQKIETTVGTLSDNTNGLIKAAWDKMLGSVGQESDSPPEANPSSLPINELAAGIAAEIRSEFETNRDSEGESAASNRIEALEQSLIRLEKTIQNLNEVPIRVSKSVDRLLGKLRELSPEARQLMYSLRHCHLTKDQYRKLSLSNSVLEPAINELRDKALLVPLESREKELVYFFPGGLVKFVEPAMLLLPPSTSEIIELVSSELKKVGYEPAK